VKVLTKCYLDRWGLAERVDASNVTMIHRFGKVVRSEPDG